MNFLNDPSESAGISFFLIDLVCRVNFSFRPNNNTIGLSSTDDRVAMATVELLGVRALPAATLKLFIRSFYYNVHVIVLKRNFLYCLLFLGGCFRIDDDGDLEFVDTKPDGEDIVQSSMITPFPSGNAGADRQPDEPNFFWSGSGDDPDAGMTYWITTTVYKTSLVTLTPEPSISTSSIPVISPTPPTASDPVWPIEVFQPRNWIRTVLRSRVNESSARFRQLVQSRLSRMYSESLSQFRNSTIQRVDVIVQNISRRAGDIEVIYGLLSGSGQLVEPYLAVGAVGQQQRDVTRQLCHRPVNDTQDELLCQSVVTLAERNDTLQQ